ncbi:DUF1836 domain-containing protein [Oceanobacillus sp. CAU 1775]
MTNIEKLLAELHLDIELSNHEIPDIDLYMDQVIQLFENKFAATKRNEDEKILTKTMINNYSKGKLFFPIKNKKYSKEHIMLINMIYEMKTVLSISDIKHALTKLNLEITDHAFDIEKLYTSYLELSKNNVQRFKESSMEQAQDVQEKLDQFNEEEKAYFDKLLQAMSFVNMSNYYRRAAEKIIDQMEPIETKKS